MKPWLTFTQTSDVIDMLDEPVNMTAAQSMPSL